VSALAALAWTCAASLAHAQDAPPATNPPATTGSASNGASSSNTANAGAGQAAPAAQVGVAVPGGVGFALSQDGRSRLHLGIDAGAGFDTNPYSVPNDANQFSGDVIARVRPHIDVDYPGSTLAFRGQALVDYGVIPGFVTPDARQFLLYQSLVAGDLEVNRGGMLRFALGDSFSWNSDPGFVSLGSLFNRITNDLRAGVGLTPGGGALDFRLGYNLNVAFYIDVPESVVSPENLDNMTNTLQLRADYKFLPKTGFFSTVSVGVNNYLNPRRTVGATPTSVPVSALVGVQGQILAKLAGLISAGYSNPLVFDEAGLVTGGLIGAVGQAELQWLPTPVTRIGGGFQRSFTPAPLYTFLGNNRFYASVSQLLGGRFLLNVNAGYSILEFGEEQVRLTSQTTGRLDGHLDAILGISYFFTDWMSVGVNNNLDWRVTNAEDPVARTNFGFFRNQTLVLASLRY
jgi:hypothetical protein